VRLLLDTHVWLWMNLTPARIQPALTEILSSPETDRLLSIASCWEIAIKSSTNKLPLPDPVADFLPARIAATAVRLLPVELPHVSRAATLPFHHQDPFDRLIAVQALAEGITLVTHDRVFERYGVPVIYA